MYLDDIAEAGEVTQNKRTKLKRDLQKRPKQETFNRDKHNSTKTCQKTDIQKRPTQIKKSVKKNGRILAV